MAAIEAALLHVTEAESAEGLLAGASAALLWPRGIDPTLTSIAPRAAITALRARDPPLSPALFRRRSAASARHHEWIEPQAVAVLAADPSAASHESASSAHAVVRGLRRPAAVTAEGAGVRRAGAAASGASVRSDYVTGSTSGKPFVAPTQARSEHSALQRALAEPSVVGSAPSSIADDLAALLGDDTAEMDRPIALPAIGDALTLDDLGPAHAALASGRVVIAVRSGVAGPDPALDAIVQVTLDDTDDDTRETILHHLLSSEKCPGSLTVRLVEADDLVPTDSSTAFESSSSLSLSPPTAPATAATDLIAMGVNPESLLAAGREIAANPASLDEARERRRALAHLAAQDHRASQAPGSGGSQEGAAMGVLDEVEAVARDHDALTEAMGWTRHDNHEDGETAAAADDDEDLASLWRTSAAEAVKPVSISKPARRAVTTVTYDEPPAQADDGWDDEVQMALTRVDSGSVATAPRGSSAPPGSWAVTARMTAEQLAISEARRTPALTYPFTLDLFQREAIHHIESGESVFVAAHTSAGKTVVAEYAIALCARNCTRCVYTSPIKALSNQKYRDFRDKFRDVGLVTGDVSIDPEASCLVMTTEILRSMLYKGADLIRDIEWVIFDECHYVNDEDRGVVWEETIILLPEHVGLIFLSATSPNTVEFCEWVGRTKRRFVHVITTPFRPVPLQHHVWARGELFTVLMPDGKFLSSSIDKAADKLAGGRATSGGRGAAAASSSGRRGGGRPPMSFAKGDRSQWTSMVKFLDSSELTPTVIFVFSKKICEEIAGLIRSQDLTTAAEKGTIRGILDGAASRLRGSDRSLPQILWLRDLLVRGIGVHHGGLLPILKECVEILFGRGLVKILLATETFAMGVNMPARTVVFGSIRKHDGKGFRYLLPGEYTQMAGRAGRRGKDTVGTVIIACFGEEPPEVGDLHTMLTGRASPLKSQFRLTYAMLLSLMRVEELSVADMMRQSFAEFATQRRIAGGDIPALLARGAARLRQIDEDLAKEPCIKGGAPTIAAYVELVMGEGLADRRLVSVILGSGEMRSRVLIPGRLVAITAESGALVPAIILRLTASDAATWMVTVLTIQPATPDTAPPAREGPVAVGQALVIGDVLARLEALPGTSIVRIFRHRLRVGADAILAELDAAARGADTPMSPSPAIAASSVALKARDDPFALFGGGGAAASGGGRSGRRGGSAASADATGSSRASKAAGGRAQIAVIVSEVQDLLTPASARSRSSATRSSAAYQRSLLAGLEPLDPARDLAEVGDLDVIRHASAAARARDVRMASKCEGCASLERQWDLVARRRRLEQQLLLMRQRLSNASLRLFPELRAMLRVLDQLAYVRRVGDPRPQPDRDEPIDGTGEGEGAGEDVADFLVELKGRVACEVNSAHAVVLTELIFEGVLNTLEPEEAAALLSALVCENKQQQDDAPPRLPPRLEAAREAAVHIAEAIGGMQAGAGLDCSPSEFARQVLNFSLAEVVHEWALGTPFATIMTLVDGIQEGTIVRVMTRLDTTCREVRNAARIIGDPQLFKKMEAASAAIKRDVIFCGSLYVV